MLEELTIRNYRGIKELELTKLRRVCLITGKNAVSKTSILEAIYIYANSFSLLAIHEILNSRGELQRLKEDAEELGISIYEHPVLKIFNRDVNPKIGVELVSKGLKFGCQIVNFTEERVIDDSGYQITNRRLVDKSEMLFDVGLLTGLNITRRRQNVIIPTDRVFQMIGNSRRAPRFFESSDYNDFSSRKFLNYKNSFSISFGDLWDEISLTDNEKVIISALKIIESRIEGITFVQAANTARSSLLRSSLFGRICSVKLEGVSEKVLLGSLGDGISRILEIMLTIITSKGGIVLIDEIENGLHYSVQKDLWKIIFEIAHELKVQVIATTHSSDTVTAFSEVAFENNTQGDKFVDDGALIRIVKRQDDSIYATDFDENDLEVASKNNIELR